MEIGLHWGRCLGFVLNRGVTGDMKHTPVPCENCKFTGPGKGLRAFDGKLLAKNLRIPGLQDDLDFLVIVQFDSQLLFYKETDFAFSHIYYNFT